MYLRLNRNIERRDRFVGNDEIGIDRECASDTDALALAAGKLVWISLDETLAETDCLQQFLHALLRFPASRQTKRLEWLADDLADRHAWVQRRVRILKNDLQVTALFAQLSCDRWARS